MSNTGKDRITVSISPYIKNKMDKYVGKGNMFSSASDAANTALIELFFRIEQEEKRENESEK
jgi:Arc/MetJ-type ribon-helix-helix transcriptional regulator